MTKFICPVCKEILHKYDKSLSCKNGHSYDLSKHGYVNLMRSQKSSKKRHGDDKLMLNSRHDFLNKGYYKPLLEAITDEVIKKADGKPITLLDVGCGEGYYTAHINNRLENSDCYGIDISKDALICAAKRDRSLCLAVASCSEIPLASKSCDVVLNIFSPTNPEEYARVLNNSGILIKAIPLENHLFGLKKSIYDKPYTNKVEDNNLAGFQLIDFKKLNTPSHSKATRI